MYERVNPAVIPYAGKVRLAIYPKMMKPAGPGQKMDFTTAGITSGP